MADAMRSRKEEGRSEAGGQKYSKEMTSELTKKAGPGEKGRDPFPCVCNSTEAGCGVMAQTWAVSRNLRIT